MRSGAVTHRTHRHARHPAGYFSAHDSIPASEESEDVTSRPDGLSGESPPAAKEAAEVFTALSQNQEEGCWDGTRISAQPRQLRVPGANPQELRSSSLQQRGGLKNPPRKALKSYVINK